jgi:hypothetical protein
VGRIVHKRSTWVAWSMLAIFVVAWAINVLLSAAAGSFQEDASLLPAAMAFTAFMSRVW